MKRICVLPGDGIGPEVIASAVRVLQSVTDELEFKYAHIGLGEFERTGYPITDETLQQMKGADSCLFGAVTSSTYKEYQSPVLRFRKELDLFANIRPIRSLLPLPGKPYTDLIIVRENTEGMYTQDEAVDLDGVTTFRRVSRHACERIVRFAFDRSRSWKKRRICCVHKANVLRKSDGLFLEIFREISKDFHGDIETSEQLVDSAAMNLVTDPSRFEVIVTLNLYGDILSDVAAGMVGGLGFAPSGNIGTAHSVFEPCHGSAPDISGKGIANPTAAILASAMMLRHLGMVREGDSVEKAVQNAYSSGNLTRDLGGAKNSEAFTDSVIDTIIEE